MLEPGDQIDIWVVEKALGSGGMGSVYRCHNRTAVRILAAVKVLEGNLRKFKEAETRFIREAEILFQLDHPNIVKVRNIRTDMDPPYLEMEFVEGQSLEQMLRQGPLNYELAVQFIQQMTSAVEYLHARGIRHRDIKPANLLVKQDGNIKLVDFGLAMEADTERITQQGMTFGTVSYAPPEWITPDVLDPSHWDIYALGVVFYEMLTGKLAFPVSGQGSIRQQAMQVIVGKQDHAPLDIGSKFPDALRELVMSMCYASPKDRIQSAAEARHRAEALDAGKRHATGVTLLPGAPPESPETLPAREAPQANTWTTGGVAPSRTSLPDGAYLPKPSPDVPAPKTTVRRGAAVVAGGALAVALGVGILGSLALVWSQSASTPTARPLEVTVTGLPDESPVRIRLGNQIPNRSDGFVHAFDSAPVGTNDLTWVQGERCSLSDCPGAACPSWCFSKTTPIEVEPGEDSQAVAVDLAPPPKRVVRVQTPQLEKTWALDFTLGDHRGAAEEGAVVFTEVQPGAYTLRAQVGECPPEASNCWTDGDCPPGCSAYTGEFIVPWGEDEHTWDLEVTDPKPSRNANLRRTPEAPSPAPAPTSDGVASASTAVSHAGFASWLSQRPDWQKDAAVNAGRADKNYLAGWDGVTPPSAGAVKNVSWYAASAFCKSRGGLASVDAEPHRWAESPSQPYVEWRSDAGKAAWRSSDGRNSSKGIDLKTSNGVTGFRCAR